VPAPGCTCHSAPAATPAAATISSRSAHTPRVGRIRVFEWNVWVSLFITITFAVLIATPSYIKLIEHILTVSGLAQKRISCNHYAVAHVSDIFCIAAKTA
jgi:hypothetical protein